MAPTRFGDLHIDLERGTVSRGARKVTLTTKETGLLAYLLAHAGRSVSREELLREVWGYSADTVTRTVDNYISRVRSKIEEDPAEPQILLTDTGLGYRLVPPGDGAGPSAAPVPAPEPPAQMTRAGPERPPSGEHGHARLRRLVDDDPRVVAQAIALTSLVAPRDVVHVVEGAWASWCPPAERAAIDALLAEPDWTALGLFAGDFDLDAARTVLATTGDRLVAMLARLQQARAFARQERGSMRLWWWARFAARERATSDLRAVERHARWALDRPRASDDLLDALDRTEAMRELHTRLLVRCLDPEGGVHWMPHLAAQAEASIEDPSLESGLRAGLLLAMATRAIALLHIDEAERLHDRAVALGVGPEHKDDSDFLQALRTVRRGKWADTERMVQAHLDDLSLSPFRAGRWHSLRGFILYRTGDEARAIETYEVAYRLLRPRGASRTLINTTFALALARSRDDSFGGAALRDEVEALLQAQADPTLTADVMASLGGIYAALGDRQQARRAYEVALAAASETTEARGVPRALLGLCSECEALRDFDGIERLLDEIAPRLVETPDPNLASVVHYYRGMLAGTHGNAPLAARFLREARRLRVEPGIDVKSRVRMDVMAAAALCGAGALDEAREALGEASGTDAELVRWAMAARQGPAPEGGHPVVRRLVGAPQ